MCRVDLLDHQIHHHVVHVCCKFCKVELRVLDKDVDLTLAKKKIEIKQTDMKTCEFCYRVFARRSGRKLHEHMKHDEASVKSVDEDLTCVEQGRNLSLFQCESCEKNFCSKIALDYHVMKIHTKSEIHYECDKCDKKFQSKETLKRHTLNAHEIQILHECSMCTLKFRRKDILTRHQRDVHYIGNINWNFAKNSDSLQHLAYPYKCNQCDKRFKRKEHLKQHEERKACKKIIACPICKISFTKTSTLKRHQETVHILEKNYECKKCGKKFGRKDTMLKHCKICEI